MKKRFKSVSFFKNSEKKYGEVKAAKTKYMAANCPGCYLAFWGTSWMRGIKVKYMPEELLRAFGDDITVPLKSRVPKIIRTILPRVPSLLKTVDVETCGFMADKRGNQNEGLFWEKSCSALAAMLEGIFGGWQPPVKAGQGVA